MRYEITEGADLITDASQPWDCCAAFMFKSRFKRLSLSHHGDMVSVHTDLGAVVLTFKTVIYAVRLGGFCNKLVYFDYSLSSLDAETIQSAHFANIELDTLMRQKEEF